MTAGEGGAVLTNDRKVYERALIYHDGGAAFRPNASTLQEPIFMGTSYRVSEITGAILRVQLRRLDGMLQDLRRVKKTIMAGLAGIPGIRFTPSHDPQGDCSTTLGVHILLRGEGAQIRQKRGRGRMAANRQRQARLHELGHRCWPSEARTNDALNPFNLPENKGLRMDYSADMCPQTLDMLSRTVYISLHPDWTEEKIASVIESCRKAADKL